MPADFTIEKDGPRAVRIKAGGRITSENSAALERAFAQAYAADPEAQETVLDAARLEYISSAGLRILLGEMKKRNLRMENVSDEVYETLSLSGFTEIMTVTKPLRRVDTTGLPILGRGGTAVVYRLDDERILKVFAEGIDFGTVLNEQRGCRSAIKAGIPSIIPFELVRCGDRFGAVSELVRSASLAERITKEPENKEGLIESYVSLVTGLNEKQGAGTGFRSMKELYLDMVEAVRADLTGEEYSCFREMITGLPEGTGFVHGDCHAGNIMCQGDELLLIDLATAGYGCWFFELFCCCFTYVLVAGMSDPAQSLGISREDCGLIWERLLDAFLGKYPAEDRESLGRKCLRYAKLKAVLSTLPNRALAQAFAGPLGQMKQDILNGR